MLCNNFAILFYSGVIKGILSDGTLDGEYLPGMRNIFWIAAINPTRYVVGVSFCIYFGYIFVPHFALIYFAYIFVPHGFIFGTCLYRILQADLGTCSSHVCFVVAGGRLKTVDSDIHC